MFGVVVFFFEQKTAYEMRISDWSSDVCSSDLRLLPLLSGADAALYGGARSLVDWHARHRFCAVCGSPTELFRGGWGRRCGSCNAEHFPRVDPVVIMLAECEGRVLVGRQGEIGRAHV